MAFTTGARRYFCSRIPAMLLVFWQQHGDVYAVLAKAYELHSTQQPSALPSTTFNLNIRGFARTFAHYRMNHIFTRLIYRQPRRNAAAVHSCRQQWVGSPNTSPRRLPSQTTCRQQINCHLSLLLMHYFLEAGACQARVKRM